MQKEVQEAEAKLDADKSNTDERKKKGAGEHATRKRNEEQLHETMDKQIDQKATQNSSCGDYEEYHDAMGFDSRGNRRSQHHISFFKKEVESMLQGIEEHLEPTVAVTGNAYEIQDSLPADLQFAPNLRMAAERLGNSTAAHELFGMEFVDHFVTSRLWEAREYERHVNSWQLERYFEII